MNTNDIHFPLWLQNNPLFRKLFLLRKLYLTKTTFKHHAFYAEDVSIARLLPQDHAGFFVDVGCYHPVKYNNTYALYKRGWRGINIDIDQIKVDGFNWLRPKDTNITCAVSNTTGSITFYSKGLYSLTSTLDPEFVGNKAGYIEQTVPCQRLTDIIDQSQFKDTPIDLLSVDVEGHDLQVLQSLDFDRYDPALIAVETHRALFTEVTDLPLYQYLIEKNYTLVAWCGLTLLLAAPRLQQQLAGRTN